MTVRSVGSEWWRKLVDRYEIRLFRRVQKVEFTGPQFTRAHLQKVAGFQQLRTLVLNSTSTSPDEVTEWQHAHPQVEVRIYTAKGQRTLAALQ